MKPSGLDEAAKAKADGRWTKAYDSPKDMQLPDDFVKALSKNKKAKAFFETLNKQINMQLAGDYKLLKSPRQKKRE